jgi:hypothetical protein
LPINDTILGALIGGLVVSIVPVVSLGFEFRKWKRERLVTHLKTERERLSKLFDEIKEDLKSGMTKDRYPFDMALNILRRCPRPVSKAFANLIAEKERTPENYKEHYVNIIKAMSEVLADLDKRIESAYS